MYSAAILPFAEGKNINSSVLSNPPIEILTDFICLLLRKGGLERGQGYSKGLLVVYKICIHYWL